MIKDNQTTEIKRKITYVENNIEIGYIEYEKLYEIIDIINVYVSELERNKHIATKMFEYLINNNEFKKIMLEVSEYNIPAINLYKKLNFKQIHIREKYYKDANALIMEMIK